MLQKRDAYAILALVIKMSISENLNAAIQKSGISYRELSDRTGVPKSAIQRYASGETEKIPIDRLKLICEALGINVAYIMGWDSDASASPSVPDLPNIVPLRRIRVPILGDIAAGEPVLAEEHLQEYAELDENAPSCDYGLRVTSDSMEPTIRPGDLVFIRQQDDVDDGQIAAVLLDDSATLKHIYHMPGGLQLLSENVTKYPPRVVTFEEYNTIKILGLAVAYRRKL